MTEIKTDNGCMFKIDKDGNGGAFVGGMMINFIVTDEKLKDDIIIDSKEGFNQIGEMEFESFYQQGNVSIFKLIGIGKLTLKQKAVKK